MKCPISLESTVKKDVTCYDYVVSSSVSNDRKHLKIL